jgi:hypothetical protein
MVAWPEKKLVAVIVGGALPVAFTGKLIWLLIVAPTGPSTLIAPLAMERKANPTLSIDRDGLASSTIVPPLTVIEMGSGPVNLQSVNLSLTIPAMSLSSIRADDMVKTAASQRPIAFLSTA